MTKHWTEENGIHFCGQLNADHIELIKNKHCAFGTTIRIPISKDTADDLAKEPEKWDWYALDSPSVIREHITEDGKTTLQQKYTVPHRCATLPLFWRRVEITDMAQCDWTYMRFPDLICNGIKIPDGFGRSRIIYRTEHDLTFMQPKVSVFDLDGILPINLARSELMSNPLQLLDDLKKDIYKDWLAHTLINMPQVPMQNSVLHSWTNKLKYRGDSDRTGFELQRMFPWISTHLGVALHAHRNLADLKLKRILLVPQKIDFNQVLIENISSARDLGIGCIDIDERYWSLDLWARRLADLTNPFCAVVPKGHRLLLRRDIAQRQFAEGKLPKYVRTANTLEWETDDWMLFTSGEVPDDTLNLKSITKNLALNGKKHLPILLYEVYIGPDYIRNEKRNPDYAEDIWWEYLNSPTIAFDYQERQDRSIDAFKKLSSYISAHAAETDFLKLHPNDTPNFISTHWIFK